MIMNRIRNDQLDYGSDVPAISTEADPSEESTLKALAGNVEEFLRHHPQTVIIAAAAMGMALGWLVKRKGGE